MKCESCSADISPASELCEFCGTYVLRTAAIILDERPEPDSVTPEPEAPPPPRHSHGEILSQLNDSDQYRTLLRSRDIDNYPIPASLYSLFVTWCVTTVVIGAMAIGAAFFSIPLAILPAVAAIGFLWMTFKYGKIVKSFNASSAIPIPAIVIRQDLLPPNFRRPGPEAYVTFELEKGNELRQRIWDADFYNRLEVEDAGFLICRAGIALDFHRVSI